MNEELRDQYTRVSDILEENFIPRVTEYFDHYITFYKSYEATLHMLRKQLPAANTPGGTYAALAKYKRHLLTLVDQELAIPSGLTFDEQFSDYNKALDEYISGLDTVRRLIQGTERYRSQPGDSLVVRVLKGFKRLGYNVAKWPEKVANMFRKLFRKHIKPLKPWHSEVKFRNYTTHYLKENLALKLTEVVKYSYAEVTSATYEVWQVDEQVADLVGEGHIVEDIPEMLFKTIDDSIKQLEDARGIVKEKVENQLKIVYESFTANYVKVGTVEISNSRFRSQKIGRLHKKVNSEYASTNRGWGNTLKVLSDDWEIDIELYGVIYDIKTTYFETRTVLDKRISEGVGATLDDIAQQLEQTIELITTSADEEQVIQERLEHVQQELMPRTLPRAVDKILAEDLPTLINRVEATLDQLIQGVSEKRAVMRGVSYKEPVRSSSISYISPFELINFETWPHFQKVTKELKVVVTELISRSQQALLEVGQVAEFNLQSALAIKDSEEVADSPRQVAIEGLERTRQKVEEIRDNFKQINQAVQQDLLQGLDAFATGLIKFTNSENIIELRMRIARGKAVARGKLFRQQIGEAIRRLLPATVGYGKRKYGEVSGYFQRTFKRYGLTSPEKAISSELADFLAETKQAIEKLPYVYQRLFSVKPLDDESFFEGRKHELTQLLNAYNHWTVGRFASVIVLAEKGSGITTLLKFYLKELATSAKVVHLSPDRSIDTEAGLVQLLTQHLEQQSDTVGDLVKVLNEGPKKVIILENLQKLFLKKVNGFAALRLLTELISLTSKNVFWVVGCTLYAWQYLNKTVGIAEHFSYPVPLLEFDDQVIVNVIQRRHKVSGYNVHFEPSSLDMYSSKFKKMTEEEQQAVLQRKFFNELNKIARSNISLALIYWLRSTKEVEGNTISIRALSDMNFSFMNTLSMPKLHVLTQLLLHDGLSEEEFQQVTGQGPRGVRNMLYPLYEDGIIVQEDQSYLINPLLYRQTVSLLKSRNIIH